VIRAGIEVYIWPAASHCPNVSISLLLFGILKLDFFFLENDPKFLIKCNVGDEMEIRTLR
jgi:hypothetical protein